MLRKGIGLGPVDNVSPITLRQHLAHPLRLLFLAPFAPRLDASNGGGRVVAQLIDHLSSKHKIALCYLRSADELPVDPVLQAKCEWIEETIIHGDQSTGSGSWRGRLKIWQQLFAGRPLWAIGRFDPVFASRMEALARSWPPDIIQVEFHVMGQFLPALKGCRAPRVLVQHEPGVETARASLRSGNSPGRWMPYLDLLAWQRYERKLMRQVQAVVVFTERDRRSLLKLNPRPPIFRIPFGTVPPALPGNPLGCFPPSLLFVGNFIHPPNIDAAVHLVRDIFPEVRLQVPEARLVIVGSQPPVELRKHANEAVTIAGFVPDLTPYLEEAALVVAPLRIGGGMRVKVVEALAFGKAVVATPLAAEGLDLADGEQIILAKHDQDFIQKIIYLLHNPAERAALAEHGRTWACEHLSWEETVLEYEALYQMLLNERSQADV